MIVKVRKIGNSVGVLLSKSILEQCAIKDKVSLEVEGDTIIIKSSKDEPHDGWETNVMEADSIKENKTLIGEFEDSFDKEEWTW